MHPRKDAPERDRLCIFAAAFAASEDAFFGAAILALGLDVLACAEEDIEAICTD